MSPPERMPSKKIRHNWHLADAGAHETRRGDQRAHSKPVSRGTGDGRDKSPGSLKATGTRSVMRARLSSD